MEKYTVCSACGNGILEKIAEVGVESIADRLTLRSMPTAQGEIYECDKCKRKFVEGSDGVVVEWKYPS